MSCQSGNFVPEGIRSAASLTNAYVAATTITDAGRFNQITLNCFYTKGSLSSVYAKIEFSHDNTNFAQETKEEVGTGALTLYERVYSGASGNFQISVPINAQYIKVSFKGDTTQVDSSLAVVAMYNQV